MITYDFDFADKRAYASNGDICLNYDHEGKNEPYHKHNYYELSLAIAGNGTQIINNKPYIVQAGTFILFTKNDVHSYHSILGMPSINCCFKSKKPFFYYPNNHNTIIANLTESEFEEARHIFDILKTELKNQSEFSNTVVHQCLDMFFLILKRHSSNENQASPHWNELLTYTFSHFDKADLKTALEITHMSPSGFCHKFKKDFYVSYTTYVNQLRIEEAKRLLISSDLTIEDISVKVGYDFSRRFYQEFKKYTETTPNNFRKTNKHMR